MEDWGGSQLFCGSTAWPAALYCDQTARAQHLVPWSGVGAALYCLTPGLGKPAAAPRPRMGKRGGYAPQTRNIRARRTAALFAAQEGLPAGVELEGARAAHFASLGLLPGESVRGIGSLADTWGLFGFLLLIRRAAQVRYCTWFRATFLRSVRALRGCP